MEQESATKVSRRTALKQLSFLVCAVPLSIMAITDVVHGEGKLSKGASKYQDTPKGSQKCGNCAYILADQKSSKIVEGDISPEGWCKLWKAKGM